MMCNISKKFTAKARLYCVTFVPHDYCRTKLSKALLTPQHLTGYAPFRYITHDVQSLSQYKHSIYFIQIKRCWKFSLMFRTCDVVNYIKMKKDLIHFFSDNISVQIDLCDQPSALQALIFLGVKNKCHQISKFQLATVINKIMMKWIFK